MTTLNEDAALQTTVTRRDLSGIVVVSIPVSNLSRSARGTATCSGWPTSASSATLSVSPAAH